MVKTLSLHICGCGIQPQGCVSAKIPVALAKRVHPAVAGKFPIGGVLRAVRCVRTKLVQDHAQPA